MCNYKSKTLISFMCCCCCYYDQWLVDHDMVNMTKINTHAPNTTIFLT